MNDPFFIVFDVMIVKENKNSTVSREMANQTPGRLFRLKFYQQMPDRQPMGG